MRALDLFAGIDGWGLAAHALGWRSHGVEIMPEARATRDAAGLVTVGKDVREVHPVPGEYDMVLGGPPCQPFSVAGNGEGRAALAQIVRAIYAMGAGSYHVGDLDERSALVLEPLRVILECRPDVIALEQVRAVLPIWRAYAEVLETQGYSAMYGALNAEEYGVPQTRTRAFLVARRDGQACLPNPTRVRFRAKTVAPGLFPTATMSDALGWSGATYTISNYGTGGDPKARGRRYGYEPSATITSKANRVVVVEPDGFRRKLTLSEALRLQTFPADFPVQGGTSAQFLQVGNAVPVRLAMAVLDTITA